MTLYKQNSERENYGRDNFRAYNLERENFRIEYYGTDNNADQENTSKKYQIYDSENINKLVGRIDFLINNVTFLVEK